MGNTLAPLVSSDAQTKHLQSALHPKRACLPQVDPYPAERAEELKRLGRMYELDLHKKDAQKKGLPPTLESLPPHERFTSEERAKHPGYTELVASAISDYLGDFGSELLKSDGRWESFEEIEEALFTPKATHLGFPRPSTMDRWLEDAEFGRQRLTGAHPIVLTQVLKCELLPKKLSVTDEHVIGLIEEDNVEEAVAAKKLFIIDYHRLLEEMPTRKDTHLCSPMALFYVDSHGVCRPIAIQLYGGPTRQDLNPVFTPNDNVYAWRMAKMYFNQADMHYHLIASLFTRCMLASGIYASITSRNLSIHHPINQLLRPHLSSTLAHVDRVYRTLLSKNGPLPKVLACGYEGWFRIAEKTWSKFDFNNMSFKHDYTERVDPASPMTHYYYREDGMLLWKAMQLYVHGVVQTYYTKPDDIDGDLELKRWTRDMINHLNRFMELQTSRKEHPIVFNITSILYHVTAVFSALTHNIYQQYGWVPNAPGVIPRPPVFEKTKDQLTEKDLLSLLPDKKTTVMQVATAFVMSGLYQSPEAPHRKYKTAPFPQVYSDSLGSGFHTGLPPWAGPPSPATAPNGEPPWLRRAKKKRKEDTEETPPAVIGEHMAVVEVHGLGSDHRQYTRIANSPMPPSDAGEQVQSRFVVYTSPDASPGLTRWEIRKAPGKIGNWVAPEGEFPTSGPAEASSLRLQAHFYARRVDPRTCCSGEGIIFVRCRSGTALLPAATSVGESNYDDGFWEILFAFETARGGAGSVEFEEVTPQWEEVDEEEEEEEEEGEEEERDEEESGAPRDVELPDEWRASSLARRGANTYHTAFVDALREAMLRIDHRNSQLPLPYSALDPRFMRPSPSMA